jgi:hypothetical protein
MSKTEKPDVGAAESVGTVSCGLDAYEDSESPSLVRFLFHLVFSSRELAGGIEVTVRDESDASSSSDSAPSRPTVASDISLSASVATSGTSPASGRGGREERKTWPYKPNI